MIDAFTCDNINKVIEANCKNYEKPKSNSDSNFKFNFITNKYKIKSFLKTPSVIKQKNKAYEYVFKLIDSENLLEIFNIIKCEIVEINAIYDFEGVKLGFIHYAAKVGKLRVFKLLFCLDFNIELQDSKKLKPIDYATISKNVNYC